MAVAMPSIASSRSDLKPGQLLITGFRGTKPGDAEVDSVCKMLEAGLCAGVILLSRNCTSPEQISRLSRAFRDSAAGLAPVISIDQEGGRVARLSAKNGFLDWMSAQEIASSGMSDQDIESYWTLRAWQLSEVGINLNYAPVVDININPNNPIIGRLGRAFGSEPDYVTHMAKLFVRAHRAAGVKTCLKHFPGHGSSSTDSHKNTVNISDSWEEIELNPFADLIRDNLCDSVMNGHLLHPSFSDEPWIPASLSWHSLEVIRKTIGFRGPVFTDDMQMAAVEDLLPLESAAVAAINAGNTFLIYSNYRKSDRIDTVERIAASLMANIDRMSPASLEDQIRLASDFRSRLR